MKQKILKKLTFISVLKSVFFFSGFASLIYQVVWQRLLTLYYGVGAISITIIVSVYMMGLGLGALLGGSLAERVKNKTQLYFWVEFSLGLFGLASLPLLSFLGKNTAGSNYLLSLFYMFLFLLIPTVLMGITLPLLTKIYNSVIQNFFQSVSYLYFINTLGAALGSVFASYVIISFFGLAAGIYFAVTVNLILAFIIFSAKKIPTDQPESSMPTIMQGDRNTIFGKIAYLLVFVTGFLAIGYELVWFRVVGILVKASTYSFSTVLTVYLLSVALGSYSMNKWLKKRRSINKKSLYFFFQFLIGIYVAVIFIGFTYIIRDNNILSYLTASSFEETLHPNLIFLVNMLDSQKSITPQELFLTIDIFTWPSLFMLIPTFLMGASFPLVSSLALTNTDKEGATIGNVYFFNVFGNMLGGILTGFLILPSLGTENTLLLFSSIGIGMGFLALSHTNKRALHLRNIVIIVLLLAGNISIFPDRGQLYVSMHTVNGANKGEYFFEEGIEGINMTFKNGKRLITYINGLAHGGRPNYSFHAVTIETVKYPYKMDNVLIIGFGTGGFAEIVLNMPEVKKVTIVELSDSLMKNLLQIDIFREMLEDVRVELVIDDGRRFLQQTDEKYDLIMVDPLRITTAYSNNLYSQQFFKLVKQHLEPGGVFYVYLEDDRKVMPKTLAATFDHVRMYNGFCMASNMPLQGEVRRVEHIMGIYPPEIQELISEVPLTYLGDKEYIVKTTEGFPINTDWNPVNEYYLGITLKRRLSLYNH